MSRLISDRLVAIAHNYRGGNIPLASRKLPAAISGSDMNQK
jgi:hypothetical protein